MVSWLCEICIPICSMTASRPLFQRYGKSAISTVQPHRGTASHIARRTALHESPKRHCFEWNTHRYRCAWTDRYIARLGQSSFEPAAHKELGVLRVLARSDQYFWA